MTPSLLILPVLFLAAALATPVPTQCDQQLYNYFVALGLNTTAYPAPLPVLNFTPGTLLGVSLVEVTIGFQWAARLYQAATNASLVNQTWISGESFDNPWCASDVTFVCAQRVVVGMAKTGNCSLVDFDLGGSDPVAGRTWIYSNQSAGCDGIPIVTFYNVSMQAGTDAQWTYDAVGMRDHVLESQPVAQQTYRSSTCAYSNGDPADVVTQNLWRCEAPVVGCNGTRSDGTPTLPVLPLPSYACLGNVTANGTAVMIWRIESYQEPDSIDGDFGLAFSDSLNSGTYVAAAASARLSSYVLVSGTRRQFQSPYSTMEQWALLYFNGAITNFQAGYPLSLDPIIEVLPCICGFSVDCIGGVVDTTSDISAYMYLQNALPVPNPGPDQQIPWLTPSFTLNGTGSYDPDELPGVLRLYWKVYSTPYDPNPPPFDLQDPTNALVTINTSALTPGTYLFVLYASDSQTVTFTMFNLTILENVVTAVVENSKIVLFDFYSGADVGHNCISDYPPAPYITLNGSLSYGTNPAVPLTYEWLQIGGFPLLYKCDPFGFEATRGFFNTTEPIAFFVPGSLGQYLFQLTVCDNSTGSCSVGYLQVQVNPNFQQPNSTFTPIINFTDPPIRNLTQPDRPVYDTPNVTLPPLGTEAPVAPPPPSNTTVPPIIPVYPPLTIAEVWALVTVLLLLVLLMAILVLGWILQRRKAQFRYLDTVTY